jgi:hypothetical protein
MIMAASWSSAGNSFNGSPIHTFGWIQLAPEAANGENRLHSSSISNRVLRRPPLTLAALVGESKSFFDKVKDVFSGG